MSDGRAIIVGGAGGIGSNVTRRLAGEGYKVVIADFEAARAKKVLGSLEGEGHGFVRIDVTDPETVSTGFDTVEQGGPASVLVVASGGPIVHLGQDTRLANMSLADWEKTLSLNLTGVFNCIQKFAQIRLKNPLQQARIVIVGSAAGLLPGNGTDVAYSVSKTALFGLARQAAFELASVGITVNVVAPGPVGTPEFVRNTNEQIRAGVASLSPLNRIATPDEVSAAIMYLLSAEASFVTGATLDVNGGLVMR